jgi:C4-dicarboxylate transporter, DctM subunit
MEMGLYISLILFFIGLLSGLPVGWVFLGTIFLISYFSNMSPLFVAGSFFHSLSGSIYMAITFFFLAGALMAQSGVAEKVLALASLLVGKMKGGLIAVGIVSSYLFGALTGSSIPCVAALIPLLVEPLEKNYGYEKRYTAAVICASSPLGYLIPPSVPVLIYCLLSKQSVAAVFLSTIVPGTLMALGYLILNYFISEKYRHFDSGENNNINNNSDIEKIIVRKNKIKIIFEALPALGTPLLIFVGIYGGICTPSEAGSLAVIYTLLIGTFVYRKLDSKKLLSVTYDSVLTVGMIFILIAMGIVLGRTFARVGIAQVFIESMLGIAESKIVILLFVNLILFILGMFIDATPTMIILVPLMIPVMNFYEVNLVQFGAIFVVAEGLAVITPPFAITLFATVRLSGVLYEKLIPPILLYLFLVGVPVLLLTTFIPAISCWLPTIIMGSRVVGSW